MTALSALPTLSEAALADILYAVSGGADYNVPVNVLKNRIIKTVSQSPDADEINAAITAVKTGGDGFVVLPPGQIELDAPIKIWRGIHLIGAGSHLATAHPGTTLTKASGYTGAGIQIGDISSDVWSAGSIKHLQCRGFDSYGIEVKSLVTENATIDDVGCVNNGDDGIHFSTAVAHICRLGSISCHSNAGAGISLQTAAGALCEIESVVGDNNDDALIVLPTVNAASIVRIKSWRSEWTSAGPGNPSVVRITTGNGALVDLGIGVAYVGSGVVASSEAIIRQTGTPALVKFLFTRYTESGDYAYGYEDENSAVQIAVADLNNKQYSDWAVYS